MMLCLAKASNTIQELRQLLEHEPVVGSLSDGRVEHCDYSYGAAGQRLRNMLAAVTQPKTVLFAEYPHVTH